MRPPLLKDPMRRTAASRLRRLANRVERQSRGFAGQSPAPLIRLGGRWWSRDDLNGDR